jgi:phosphoglycerate dehydrogenase-like enzyme
MSDSAVRGSADFRTILTGDFVSSEGHFYFDADALSALKGLPASDLQVLNGSPGTAVPSSATRDADAVIMKRSPLAPDVLSDPKLRTVLISRNGVGYEHLDIAACTRAGVMVTTTPDASRRAVASSAVTLLLACAHRLLERDSLVRRAGWHQRHTLLGTGLAGKTLGLIGAGNIGREIFTLLAPWEMRRLVCSQRRRPEEATAMGAELVDFESLLRESDFLVLACRLSEETRHLIDARALSLMKPTAYIINIARGAVIDEAALVAALSERRIAGAGLDVLEVEPPRDDHPLFALDNIVLSPHSLSFSDESNRLANKLAAENVIALARGSVSNNLVNPEVLDHPRVVAALKRRAWCGAVPVTEKQARGEEISS